MPYICGLLFFVFDYLRPGSYIPAIEALHLNSLIPIVGIVGTMVLRTPISNRDYFADTNAKIMGALLFLLVLSTAFAQVTTYAYDVLEKVWGFMLIGWVIARNSATIPRLKGVFMTLVGVHIAVGILNPELFTNPESRVGINSGAFIGDGNDFSLSVNICVPLALFVLLESKKKLAKVFWILALVMLVLSIVATKSRGGTLALGSVALYYWLQSDRKVLMAALFVALLGIVIAVAPPMYFDRMGTIGDTTEGSAQGRLIAWGAAIKMAAKNPILGAGAGHFPTVYGTTYRAEGGAWITAHSIYFLVLGELGVPGIIVLLTFFFSNWANNRRLLRQVAALPEAEAATIKHMLTCTSVSLLAFAVGGAFLSVAYYPHLYVLSAVMVATRAIALKHLEKNACGETPGQATHAPAAKPPVSNSLVSPEWSPRPARASLLVVNP